ncbi:MAG TPA: hypothetical protein VMW12_09760 [Candidatus Dormibacteraeota bacterium]|nr:hypothetical protein [Candidatus Dormibacteraeota bacterium]
MSLAFDAMPADENRVAGVLVGALMAGEGMGTFAVGVLHGSAGFTLAQVYRVAGGTAVVLALVAFVAVRAGSGKVS